MGQEKLFADAPTTPAEPKAARRGGKPRLREANRGQVTLQPVDLDSMLPPDHQARTLWAALERLDLSGFYDPIDARDGVAGRNATDPKILVCLWLYATSEGIGSARELDRLATEHIAYRWICGGVSVNYHLLAEFRISHTVALEALLVDLLARLYEAGLVTLRRVAHDGMRVRASAGAASFRRKDTLKQARKEAKWQVAACKKQLDDPTASTKRSAVEKSAAEAKLRQLDRALEQMKVVEKAKAADPDKKRRAKEPRVSTTDPDARVMKMPDGGFRPAYNVQLSTDADSRVIVGVGVSNVGSDSGQLVNALDGIEARLGTPEELLVDGGFVSLKAIGEVAQRGVTLYAPVPERRTKPGADRHERRPGDSDAVAEWRERMATDEAKELYKERAATAETTNADLREHRGLDGFNVRGIAKVLSVTLWAAVTYNLLRTPLEALTLWT